MFTTDLQRFRVAGLPLSLLLAAFIITGCQDESPAEPPTPETSPADEEVEAATMPWPRIERESDPEVERFVEDVLSRMTLERKVGQIIQAEIQHVTPEEVRDYALGSVLNGGGSFPGGDQRAAMSDWTELSRRLHEAALETGGGDPSVPLLWGTDAVHGHNNVFGATVFPHNIGLGAAGDAELVREINRATAEQVSATAIDWNFSPTLAVARDLRWGRSYESYSSDPSIVTELSRAAVLGLQGEPGEGWLESPHVLATAKHFVGDGGTVEGEDQGDTRLSEQELFDIHGLPYVATIEAGVQTIMASFSSWNGEKLHGHRYLLTEVLKEQMGFDGIVVGDWNGHGQVPGCTVTDCLQAFEAGIDLFMVPEDWKAFRDTMLEHARNGDLSMDRLDDAVRRILRVKKRAGLFDQPVPSGSDQLPNEDAHAELARRAVRQSLVLLKNTGDVLPLDPGSRILVVGDGADDIGKQSGGWTLTWQGLTEANEYFPNGQSIFDGIAEQVRAAGGEIHLGASGAEEFAPDVVIAIYGENPYSEGEGDVDTLEFQPGTREAIELLDQAGQWGAPVVSVFLSGRPLWTNPEMNRSDAFVAAWLPGTAGGGVADVLLADADGDVQYDFSGRLSFDWPATPKPDEDGEWPTLFPLGSGLSYGEDGSIDPLPEDALAPLLEDEIPEQGDWTLFDRSARTPWRLVIMGHNNAADPAVELTDREVQGDARRLTWSAGVPGFAALTARPPVDLRGFVDDNAVLAYDLRPETPIPEDLSARLICGQQCASEALGLAGELADRPLNEWQSLRIDLTCFDSENMDLSHVSGIELLRTEGPVTISVSAVRIERGATDRADLSCSS